MQVNTCKQNVKTWTELLGKLHSNNTVFSCLSNVGSNDEEVTSAGKVVPHTGCNCGKGAVTNSGQTCRWNNECVHRRRMQATPRVKVRHCPSTVVRFVRDSWMSGSVALQAPYVPTMMSKDGIDALMLRHPKATWAGSSYSGCWLTKQRLSTCNCSCCVNLLSSSFYK